MFEVTEMATKTIKEAFKDKPEVPLIRIQFMRGG